MDMDVEYGNKRTQGSLANISEEWFLLSGAWGLGWFRCWIVMVGLSVRIGYSGAK